MDSFQVFIRDMIEAIEQVAVGPMENFCYLLKDFEKSEAIIIDPAWEPDRLVKKLKEQGLKLKAILISHHHHDHTNGVEALLKDFDCPVYVHKEDVRAIRFYPNSVVKSEHEDSLIFAGTELKMIHSPGHTAGSQCFLWSEHLFTGDTLFIDGCGRCDLPDSDPEKMYTTLKRQILTLDPNTQILPGHDYGKQTSQSLSGQIESNRYLKLAQQDLQDFVNYRMR